MHSGSMTASNDTLWLNRATLQPGSRKHVESYFIKGNGPNRQAFWLKLTLLADGDDQRGEVWAILFDGQSHHHRSAKASYGMDRVSFTRERPGIDVGPCSVDAQGTRGHIEAVDWGLSWDIEFEDESPPYVPFPSRRLYGQRWVRMKTVTPHPSAQLQGTLQLWEGLGRGTALTEIDVTGWRGMQGHNWGTRHAQRYAWCHCNAFQEVERGAYLEAFAGQVAFAGLLTPPLFLGRLVLPEGEFRFDRVSNVFSSKTQHDFHSWSFESQGPEGVLRANLRAPPEDMVGLHYANPGGPTTHCLNSKLASLTLELDGPTLSRKLTSDQAALEIGTLDPEHGITMAL